MSTAHVAATAPARLASFYEPRSIAVIGASRDPRSVGGCVLANLVAGGFAGRIIPVNRNADRVQGLPAVASVLDIAEAVDLAVITVPASQVLDVLAACEAKGVGGAVVISAGFREIGEGGTERERTLREWVRGRGVRVIGPNCLGWIRPACRLNATFAPGMPARGNIAFISHSGALAVGILDWSRERSMGFSLFASLGNQCDVSESDVLAATVDDPETRVIAAYLEGVADGRRFAEALGELAGRKPVVILKVGRSPEAARAVVSHTGAMAGSDLAFEAAVRQAGALRVRSIEELFDQARALASQPIPAGRRVMVLTNGGGLGVVATDAARDAGLHVVPTPEAVREPLRAVLPPTASLGNPIDLVGDADAARFAAALGVLARHPAFDALLVLLTAQAATDSAEVARAVLAGTRAWAVPVVAALVGGPRLVAGARLLEAGGVPCYAFPETAVAALAGMARLGEHRIRQQAGAQAEAPGAPPWVRLAAGGSTRLGMAELRGLLKAYEIPAVACEIVTTPQQAAEAAQRLGFPVALKVVSPDIVHKTDVGGVRLGLASAGEVAGAMFSMFTRLHAEHPDAVLSGVLVQKMAERGTELILGAVRDPQFGPVVVVGMGGIYTEVFRDIAARLAPVTAEEARAMLEELRVAPLLRGVRGQRPVDLRAVASLVSRFSRLAVDRTDLVEVEINPLVVGPAGGLAVDARATLCPPST